jgi:PhnB protein
MGDIKLNPYIFFGGNCHEAMEFYKNVFGGELEVQTMADVPKDAQAPSAKPTDVMHATLTGSVNLMASDSKKASPKAAKIELSLSGSDDALLRKYFDGLADGGEIRMPLEKQFWGATFGMLTDRFGIDWMINIETKK